MKRAALSLFLVALFITFPALALESAFEPFLFVFNGVISRDMTIEQVKEAMGREPDRYMFGSPTSFVYDIKNESGVKTELHFSIYPSWNDGPIAMSISYALFGNYQDPNQYIADYRMLHLVLTGLFGPPFSDVCKYRLKETDLPPELYVSAFTSRDLDLYASWRYPGEIAVTIHLSLISTRRMLSLSYRTTWPIDAFLDDEAEDFPTPTPIATVNLQGL